MVGVVEGESVHFCIFIGRNGWKDGPCAHSYRNPENLYDKEVGGGDESKASSSRRRSHSKR